MAKRLTKEEQLRKILREIEKILKGFSIDVIIRRELFGKDWVVVETHPAIWISSVEPQEKEIVISIIAKDIKRILGEWRVGTVRSTAKISYSQFKKLVGRLLIEMFAKTFIEFIPFD